MKRVVFAALLFTALLRPHAGAEPLYKRLSEIQIGGEGGWDILTIDGDARRLYLSHAVKVVVVDIDANKIVGEIADTPGVHAFVAVPEIRRGFSSNGKENKSSVVDLETLGTTAKLDTGNNPDAVVCDHNRGEVYVFNHTGNSATVIDAKATKVIATIPLDGSPEFAVVDEAAGRVYCNIEDKSEIAVIDAAKHEVIANWALSPGQEPTGIALDPAHHRVFAACRKLLVMLDSGSGKVVATVPTGNGADGCAFDDSSQLVFVPCGEGVITIAKEESPDRLAVVETVTTQRGARTIALDPKTHRIFLPTADFQPPPAQSASPARPTIVPNTQKLLVFGPADAH